MTAIVDERGRVLVPKDLRAQFGLEPGSRVLLEADADGIKLRRAIPRKAALDQLAGIIPKSKDRPKVDHSQRKRLWEPRK